MNINKASIREILHNTPQLVVPPFQRSYAWGKPEIEQFFSDISRIIDSGLKQEHFLGVIVVKDEPEPEGVSYKSIIVDGQQRLTTAILLIIALRDLEPDQSIKDAITSDYLIYFKGQKLTPEYRIKLKLANRDRDAFQALVNNEKPIPSIITNAYRLLKELIEEKKKDNPNIKSRDFINALDKMEVALVRLEGEDPQIIFETLNSLGKPLTLADLARNYIFLNIEINRQSDIYHDLWYPKIEKVLKDETFKFFGKNKKGKRKDIISEFIRDYLRYKKSAQLRVVNDNNTKWLYHQFKDFAERNFKNRHEEFVKDLVKYAKYYSWIITEINNNDQISSNKSNDKTIKELLRNIFHDIKTDVFKPFVLGLLEYHQNGDISDELLISTLEIIRTYLTRRRVLRLTEGENQYIPSLCKKIKDIAEGKVTMLELLTTMPYKLRLPNDKEMEERLKTVNFYEELKKYAKFILGKMEEKISKVSVDFRDKNITIEHIMPKELTEEWKKELGENWQEIHKRYLNNIGNLILTEFNSELGNKPFKEKKKMLEKSNLSMRKYVINKEVWNEESIKEHQSDMIRLFLDTFSLPEDYKYRNNWGSSYVEKDSFSPLDEDAQYMVIDSKPLEIRIYQKVIPVNSWEKVFIEFLKYLKNYQKDIFNEILNRQDEICNDYPIITTLGSLEQSAYKHYKTFDGRKLEKARAKNPEQLVIHTEASPEDFISRIAKIMELVAMKKDDVSIKVKKK